jgi:hypothetical protein
MVNLPIDYTSRDYVSIRADMISQIEQRLPEWTSRSPNDFGIVLLEMFAHIADSMHYYADRVANESFLSTATQRSSVLEIARLLDYQPNGNAAASVQMTFSNSTGSALLVPQRTRVGTTATRIPAPPGPGRAYLRSSSASVVFETDAAVTVPANSSAAVTATEGIGIVGEAVANSDGTANQDWDLYYSPVVDGSVVVSVNGTQWQNFDHLIDADDTSPAYTLYTDATGFTHIVFGDDVNGSIPPSGAAITADYRVGGGSIGNVLANTLTRILTPVPAGITAINLNQDAEGGSDADTIAAIKVNAPRSLYTLDRAVSARDYAQLALRVTGVGKAVLGPQTTYNSAVLYMAPSGGGGLMPDGVTPTPAWFALRDALDEYMIDRIPASSTLTILPPQYVTVTGVFNVVVAKNYPQEATRLACYSALDALLSFDNVTFGDTLSQGDFLKAILSVPGIVRVSASNLAINAVGGTFVQIESFDAVPVGATGWTLDNSVFVQGTGSISRSGIGTVSNSFSPIDLSGTGQITLRYTYDGSGVGGLTGTLSFQDINGRTFQAGSRHAGILGTQAHTSWHTVFWNDVTWPGDAGVFDATQVVSYTLNATPNGASGTKFWIDDLRALPSLIEDVSVAFNQIPTTGGNTLTAFNISATRDS